MTTLETYTVEINDAVTSMKKSSTKVFNLMCEASENLSKRDYAKLIKGITVDRSTINKIEKILANDIVMSSIDDLPASWSTLHEMTLLKDAVLKANIDDGTIKSNTTRSDIKQLRAVSISEDVEDEAVISERDDGESDADLATVTITLKVVSNMTNENVEKKIKSITEFMQGDFLVTNTLDDFLREAV